MSEMQYVIDHLSTTNAEQALEIETLKRQIRYYDNPNSQPSQNSFSSQRRKKENRIEPSEYKKSGGRKGHKGVSREKKADRKVGHIPKECRNCGSNNVNVSDTKTTYTDDIPFFPPIETVCNIIQSVTCVDCNHTTVPKVGFKGTAFGPNIMSLFGSLFEKKHYSKSAVLNAISALAEGLEKEHARIVKGVAQAGFHLIDESPIRVMCQQGYGWACTSGNYVQLVVAPTRSSIILDVYFPYHDKVIVCDGYVGYRGSDKKQRCWAHIMCEAENISKNGPEEKMSYEKLMMLLHDAKLALPDQKIHDMLVIRAKSIAELYLKLGYKFGTTLHNAADDLFTFVMHPGVPPTNNESERALRQMVIQRKIRQRIATSGGMGDV
ncbi:MAG: hypothetical protein EB828_06635 [Nitrosopumilus sp. D6]|nr:MAG: hypothetical protein EB828_06635 [Nitrosopumilus sp. D6]